MNNLWNDFRNAYLMSYVYGGGGHSMNGVLSMLLGNSQRQYQKASNQAQIDYNNYLKQAYERQLADWHKNVPNREIAYPELAYAGSIYRADTGIARSTLSNYSADANYYGNLPSRGSGLYSVGSRLTRFL